MNTNNTVRTILIPALLIAIGGCSKKEDAKAPANAAPPPPMVSVITVSPEQVTNISELPGRVEAVRTAEVRARVGGIVQKRYFNEGSEVRAGQPLYQLDPAPYMATFASARATVGQAEANVTRAEANLAQATTKLNRYRNLVESNAVSKQEFDDLSSAQKLATADVSAARAAVDTARATQETAKLNLSWATVSAPISGRIGRTLITEGALVRVAQDAPLAVIQQLDTVNVDVTQSSAELLRLQRERMNGAFVPSLKEFARFYGLDEEKLQWAAPDALVMHPGPMNEGVEIAPDVAYGGQSAVEEQVANGVAVRMAVMYLLAGGRGGAAV